MFGEDMVKPAEDVGWNAGASASCAPGQGVEDAAEQLGLFRQLLFYTSILGFNTLGKSPNSRTYVLKDRNAFICDRSSHSYMERKLANGLDFE